MPSRRLAQTLGRFARVGLACGVLLTAPQGAAHAAPPEKSEAEQDPIAAPSVASRFQEFLRSGGASASDSAARDSEPAAIEFLRAVAVVVESGDGRAIGLQAGIASVKRSNGLHEPAYLALTESGLVVPVFADGKIAAAIGLHFADDACSGTPYVGGSRENAAYVPLPGSVFRSAQSNRLYFVPAGHQRTTVRVRSHQELSPADKIVCLEEDRDLPLFEAKPVFPAKPDTTFAFDAPVSLGLPTLRPERRQRVGRRRGGGVPEQRMRRIQDALALEVEREREAECETGCPETNVGDGSCDVFCNNRSCSYDGGDCEGLSDEELANLQQSTCAQGCLRADVGDGFCDPACNVAACDHDGGDCTLAPESR